MSVSSDMTTDPRALRVYRMPAYHQRRSRGYDNRISIPDVRSPSPDEKILVARRRQSTPSTSTVRIVEVQSSPYAKRYYPHTRTTRVIREQSPLSTTSDSASTISSPTPISIVKRRPQEQRIVRIATTSTSTSSNTDVIVPITRKKRRAFVETPVAIVSETPLVNRGTSPRKQWKKREKTVPLDLDRDVYVSDEDYYEEAFPDGVSSFQENPNLQFFCCRVINQNPINFVNGVMVDVLAVVHIVIFVNGIIAVHFVVG